MVFSSFFENLKIVAFKIYHLWAQKDKNLVFKGIWHTSFVIHKSLEWAEKL